MQDTMHPASETFQSTSRVARYLVDQELPWLEGALVFGFFLFGFFLFGGREKDKSTGELFFNYIYAYIYIYRCHMFF